MAASATTALPASASEMAADPGTIFLPPYDPSAPVDRRNQIAQLVSICVLNSLTREYLFCVYAIFPFAKNCSSTRTQSTFDLYILMFFALSSHNYCAEDLVSWDQIEAVPC